jgi:hypothetical protein
MITVGHEKKPFFFNCRGSGSWEKEVLPDCPACSYNCSIVIIYAVLLRLRLQFTACSRCGSLSNLRMFKQVQEGVQAVNDASASSEAERVRKLRERVEAQEAKLRKLRALRGQVDQQRITNGSLCKRLARKNSYRRYDRLLLMMIVTL